MACQLPPASATAFPAYLREGTIIPEVAVMREAIANISELALLYILLDGVQWFLFRDLRATLVSFRFAIGAMWISPSTWLTSIFALVHLGISTTMFSTVCCSLAYNGMSWKGETTLPWLSSM